MQEDRVNSEEDMQKFTEIDNKLREDFDKFGIKAAYGTAGFRYLASHMPYVLNAL